MKDPMGEPEGLVYKPDHLLIEASFASFVTNGAIVLEANYPGWQWLLQPGQFAGMVNVFSAILGTKWGYQINVPREIRNTDQRAVWLRAGGELLERFGCPRGGFRSGSLDNTMRHPITGEFLPNADDVGSKQARARADIEARIAKGEIKLIPAGDGRFVVEYMK